MQGNLLKQKLQISDLSDSARYESNDVSTEASSEVHSATTVERDVRIKERERVCGIGAHQHTEKVTLPQLSGAAFG